VHEIFEERGVWGSVRKIIVYVTWTSRNNPEKKKKKKQEGSSFIRTRVVEAGLPASSSSVEGKYVVRAGVRMHHVRGTI
jgi:hypothetical protein